MFSSYYTKYVIMVSRTMVQYRQDGARLYYTCRLRPFCDCYPILVFFQCKDVRKLQQER